MASLTKTIADRFLPRRQSRLTRGVAGLATSPDDGATIVLVPQDLRTIDPSFADELASGVLGIGAAVVDVTDLDAFDHPAAGDAWNHALVRFGWVRHLQAEVPHAQALDRARELVGAFLERHTARPEARGELQAAWSDTSWAREIIWDPANTARRATALLGASNLLLFGAPPSFYDRYVDHLQH
ncbi:MAG: hypothetical protein AAGF32_09635 [Pseudomonadota bacterium]